MSIGKIVPGLEALNGRSVNLAAAATGDDGDEQRTESLFYFLAHAETSVRVSGAGQWILALERVMSPPRE